MNVEFVAQPAHGPVEVQVFAVTPEGEISNAASGGALNRLIETSRFAGKRDEILDGAAPFDIAADRVVLIGLGDAEALDRQAWERLGGTLAAHISDTGCTTVQIQITPPDTAPVNGGQALARLAFGMRLRGYAYDRYRTVKDEDDPSRLDQLTVVTDDMAGAAAAWRDLDAVAGGVELARDLFNQPANDLYPQSFVEQIGFLAELGIDIEAHGPDYLEDQGMGAMLAVARGSGHEPSLLVLRWSGADNGDEPPLCFIGKGLTFDCGGISIKPAKGMEEMKGDMAGGGAVVGAMRALAARNAKVNAVGVVGLVENMAGSRAYRPGDVLTSKAGWTIEVFNTDAEGRLVLLDLLAYAVERFEPAAMIDLATLTYDIMAGLGLVYTGMYTTSDRLAADLEAASEASGEKLWRMPLDQEYEDNLGSDIADLRQIAEPGEYADAAHAAQLLQRFARGRPWAHLDIAGKELAYDDKPLCPKGGTGVGVRLLDAFARIREDSGDPDR